MLKSGSGKCYLLGKEHSQIKDSDVGSTIQPGFLLTGKNLPKLLKGICHVILGCTGWEVEKLLYCQVADRTADFCASLMTAGEIFKIWVCESLLGRRENRDKMKRII